MKTFKEFKDPLKPIFESYEVEHLNEQELAEAERIYMALSEHVKEKGIENVEEGLLGSIIGGVAGFIIGPAVGKVVANALGIERGILYDMLTSRLVSAALGSTLAKNLT